MFDPDRVSRADATGLDDTVHLLIRPVPVNHLSLV